MIHIADFPQLQLISWSLPGIEEIEEREAFALYESNWKWVDQNSLTPREKELIDHLIQVFGGGLLNV